MTVEKGGKARIEVFDPAGRSIRTLFRGVMLPGSHRYTWDTRDSTGKKTPAGVYLLRLEAGGQSLTQKVSVVR